MHRTSTPGAAIAACVVATTISPALGQVDPASWWQVDHVRPGGDETSAADLDDELVVPREPSDFGIGDALVLPAAPAVAASVPVPGSDVVDHWSSPTDGLALAALLRLDAVTAAGAPQTLASRWEDEASGSWRWSAVPTGAGAAALRLELRTLAGTIAHEITIPGDEWLWAIVSVDPAAATVETVLRATDGTVVGEATDRLGAPPAASADALVLGRGIAPTGDVGLRLDVLAGWDGPLDAASQAALAGADGPARYVEYVGWAGFTDPAKGLDRIAGALQGDRRHAVFGDSFAFSAGYRRVFPAILRVVDFEPFTAMASGLRSPSALVSMQSLLQDPSGPNPRGMNASNHYRCEYVGGTDPQDHYGVPVNRPIELRAHAGTVVPADGSLLRLTVANDGLGAGASGPLGQPGETVSFRLVHRRVSDAVAPLPALRLADPEGPGEVVADLTVGPPRQAATDGHRLDVTVQPDGGVEALVREASPGDFTAPDERFANLVNVLAWRVDEQGDRVPGQYYTSLNDGSWDWENYAADEESTGGKSVSREQLAEWLRATTLDPAQPVLFWWYVSAENDELEDLRAEMEQAITIADAAAADAGILESPHHLVVVPHLHRMGGLDTRDKLLVGFARYRAAIDAIVDDPAFPRVARYSIFDATDGVYFDGRPSSIEWLADRGYDAFTYGSFTADLTALSSLLDEGRQHPGGNEAAAFFASFLGEAVIAQPVPADCPADVDGDGAVDFDDLLSVIADWGPCPGCSADVDGDGTVDFDDLLATLAAFGPCPA